MAAADVLSAADIAILAEDLAYADDVAPGLGVQLLAFVLNGDQPPLFADLDKLDQRKLFHAIAPRNYRRQEQTPQEVKRAVSRTRLHELERFDELVMIRFGNVVAVGRDGSLGRHSLAGVETTPSWLPVLFEIDQDFPDPAGRRLLTGPRCRDMLALADVSIKHLVECLFIDNGLHYQKYHEWSFTLPGLAETLAEDPPAVLEAMRALEPPAQLYLIDYLARSGLLGQPAFLDAAFGWVALRKGIGEGALRALNHAPAPMRVERVERHLASRVAAERLIGVRVAAACLEDAGSRLDAHAAAETSKVVLQTIEEARALRASSQPAAADAALQDEARHDGTDGYWAADGSYVEAPPRVEPAPSALLPDAPEALAAIIAEINAFASAEHEAQGRQPVPKPDPHEVPDGPMGKFWIEMNESGEKAWRARIAELSVPYTPRLVAGDVGKLIDIMTGAAAPETGQSLYSTYAGIVCGSRLTKAHAFDRKRFRAFFARPDVDWRHLTRLLLINTGQGDYTWSNFLFGIASGARDYYDIITSELNRRIMAGADVRAIVALLAEHGLETPWLVERMLAHGSQLTCSADQQSATLWPVLVDDIARLDAGIANAVAPAIDSRVKSQLVLLGAFPKLPRRYLKLVLDAAMSSDKPMRALARQLTKRAGDLVVVLAPMIEASEAPRRLAAIRWLGELRDAAAIPALRKALGGKRNIVDRAAIVAALAACGDDIADLFAPDKLLDEARAGLAKTKTDFSDLFDDMALPILHWADGETVAPDLVRWWFTMAHKLKQPGGDALLHMALDRLAPADAARLGDMVLSAFVAFDTRQLDATEAEAAARAELPARLQARSWDKTFTAEQAMADLRLEKLGSYMHSAHEHRGLLALARHASGPIAAAQGRHMLVKHWRRTPQGKAMLDYLASNPAPAPLQVLIGVSQRHKTAAVQAYAAAIADRLADERGWTRDELEDRTVPTADLDDSGGMNLPIGEAMFRAELDDDGALSLRNPDGKAIAALPTPKGAAAEDAKAAKAALAKLRKEVKQTIEAQRRRLHEAMCAGRVWPAADFKAFILAHPIVGRLARRLLFVGLDAKGTPVTSFRALADGTVTDAADSAVSWDKIDGVGLAHRARIEEAEAARWTAHLADYEVTPLFEQLARPYRTSEDTDATEIDDRRGFMLDTFGLRGAATKLDYVRSSIEDGGAFYAYEKRFERTGIGAVVDFTGSHVPEQQRPCALGALSFVRLEDAKGAWGSPQVALADVPPILLSEAWNDYGALAAAGTGFDPAWEARTR